MRFRKTIRATRPSGWSVGILLILMGAARPASSQEQPRDGFGDSLDAGTVRFRVPGQKPAMEFAANDRTLIIALESRVALMDAPTGRFIGSIDSEGQTIMSMRLTPDHRSVLTLGYEHDRQSDQSVRTLRQWHLQSRRLMTTRTLDSRAHDPLAITPDGETAIVGSQDGHVCFFDLASGKELLSRQFEREQVHGLAISPDGALLAISTSDAFHFWEWKEKKDPISVPLERSGISLAFSPDGRFIAASSRKEAVLFDAETKRVKVRFADDTSYVRSLAFSADGSMVAGAHFAISRDREVLQRVKLWDASTGALVRSFDTGNQSVGPLALSRDGRWLAAAIGDTLIRTWDLSTGKALDEKSPDR